MIIRAKRQVERAPLPGVRLTASETAQSTGANLEISKARLGQEIAGFGGTVANIGAHHFTRMVQEERDRADSIAILEAENELASWKNQRLYGEQGALKRLGKDAMGIPEEVLGEYQKLAGEIEKRMSPGRQQLAFARLRQQHGQDLDLTTRRHVFNEVNRYEAKELQSSIENRVSTIISKAQDPKGVKTELDAGIAAIQTHAPRLGFGPEAVKQQVESFTTAAHVGVIGRLITAEKDKDARTYFEAVKGQISGDKLEEVERTLDQASTMGDGLRTSEELWKEYGPKTNNDPILIADMEAAAREKYKDDPKSLRATISFLRERKAGVDAQRKDVAEAKSGSIYLAASQGATLQQLKQMPAFINSTEKEQADAIEYVVNRAIRQANLAQAEEGRAYTKMTRAEATKTTKGWARYWEESNPTKLSQTSENALHAMRGELGDDHVNNLLQQKRSIGKTEAQVRSAVMDDDQFKTLASNAGLEAYSPKGNAEKDALGQLKNAVETAIDAEQIATGKALNRERKGVIMQGIIDQKVMLNYWGSDPEVIAAMVTDAADRAKAYVPLAKIPAPALQEGLAFIRQQQPWVTQSDATMKTQYADRLQRAYALTLLGGTRAEVEAALKGTK